MLRTMEGHALSTVLYFKKKKDYISLLVWVARAESDRKTNTARRKWVCVVKINPEDFSFLTQHSKTEGKKMAKKKKRINGAENHVSFFLRLEKPTWDPRRTQWPDRRDRVLFTHIFFSGSSDKLSPPTPRNCSLCLQHLHSMAAHPGYPPPKKEV